jgi:asparaginyl-tRNA synthetase
MAQHVYISDIARFAGQEVTIKGWLHNRSSKGKLHFLQVRDGTGIIQCVVFKGDVDELTFHKADHLPQETAIEVTGSVREDKRSAIGFEIGVSGLTVVCEPRDEFPLGHKDHGVNFLMENRHIWLRSQRQVAILRIRHTIIKAIRDYFDDNGFTLFDAPILTPAACEGTSTLFETPYFDLGKAYLTQSGQLYGEAGALALGKIYVFGPTFRAEKSKTRRHLTEFWMVEPEVAFMDLAGDMDLMEDFVVSVVSRVLAKHERELKDVLGRDVEVLKRVQKPFPRISYTEGIERIRAAGHTIEWGDDIGGDEETILANQFDRPVLMHRFPAAMKAFYFKKDPADPALALGCDMLAPEGYGEIIGGGERETDFDLLKQAMDAGGLTEEAMGWYLDLRRYGSVPHAGFGLGIERTVAWICGLHHVRETIPFARMMERLTP